MGIQSAMYSGVSGLNANSQAMSVIGNNLANTNTLGFKASRTVFSDLLSSNVAGSGGLSQVGRGVGLSTVDNILSQGTFETTSSDTDVAIEGSGFFVIREAGSSTDYYTRAGAFRFNGDGNLVNPEGYIVQGKQFDPIDNTALQATDPSNIQVANVGLVPASATTELTYTTNLDEKSIEIPTKIAAYPVRTTGAEAGNTGVPATDIASAHNGISSDTITIQNAAGTALINGTYTFLANTEVSTIKDNLNTIKGVTAKASNEVTLSVAASTGSNQNATTNLVINGVSIGPVDVTNPQGDVTHPNGMYYVITNALKPGQPLDATTSGLTCAYNATTDTVTVRNATGADISVGLVTTQTTAGTATTGARLSVQGADGAIPATITGSAWTSATPPVPTDSGTDYVKVGGSLRVYLEKDLTLTTKGTNGLFFTSGAQTPDKTTTPEETVLVTNLIDPNDKTTFNYSASSQVFDSLGASHLVSVYWRLTDNATNTWNMAYTVDGDNTLPISTLTKTMTFGPDGNLPDTNGGGAPVPLTETITIPSTANGANPITLKLTFDCTQFDSSSVVIGQKQNGYAAGSLTNVAINGEGVVVASYSNGKQINIAQLVLAKFQNPGALQLAGSNRYTAPAATGTVRVGIPGEELGKVFTNSLEQSNVDMGSEFVKMITTQRGFSANSKIITTIDEMLSELINLKR